MMRSLRQLCLFVAVCILTHSSLVLAQPANEKLPLFADMVRPSTETLLTQPPVDWIILKTDEVLVVESLPGRPNLLEKREKEIEELTERRKSVGQAERDEITQKLNDLNSLEVIVPGINGANEFRLRLGQIRAIIHHEDHMIKRIELLLQEKKIDTALELLGILQQKWDDWPGMAGIHNDILAVDGQVRIENGNYENSLMILDELYRRDPKYRDLDKFMGQAIDALVEKAIKDKNYLRAQFFLNRLNTHFPNHPIFQRYDQQLTQLVKDMLNKASQLADAGKHREAAIEAELAASIWPKVAELRAPHRVLTERYQRLHIGVIDQPGEANAYWVGTPADLRKKSLTELPLFEVDRLRDGTAYYRTRFFDEWEPFDLGREMRFTMKQFRQPYEIQQVITTAEVVAPILERLDPSHPKYDERLATFVESVHIESPTQFTITFRRVPPRIEPLLADITLGQKTDPAKTFGPVEDPGGFQILEQTENQIVYTRKIPEPDGLRQYHVAEVVEHRYSTHEKAVQALHRGEVSVLPDVPDWILRRMTADEEFMKRYFVQPYRIPITHLIQFNPSSPALQNRALRTALAYSIDRPRILSEVVLRDQTSAHGRIVTAPFLSENPGRNVLLEPRRFDLSAGIAMTLAATQQLKTGIPELTMIMAPGVVEEEAAEEIAKTWRRIGYSIKLVRAGAPRPEQWDIMYRTTQMLEPLVELWPFLAMSDSAQLADLERYPDWFKQELVELDRTSDQSRAITALQTVHGHMWRDATVVPLWEVDKFMIIRKNIEGFPARPLQSYDGIDRWMIDAWYQTELP